MNRVLASFAAVAACAAAGSAYAAVALEDPIPAPINFGPVTVQLERVTEGISFATDIADPGDVPGRLVYTEVTGTLHLIQGGAVATTPFLDIPAVIPETLTVDNVGLTSVAFHPQYAAELAAGRPGKLYTVSGETADDLSAAHFGPMSGVVSHQNVLYEWTVSPSDTTRVDTTVPPREILRINEPRSEHNLNEIEFGPDGYAYISLGDGGNGRFQAVNGQDTTNPFGAILRLDLDDTSGNGRYSIPSDNPFVPSDGPELKEIYAYGLRNGFRIGFDPVTGDLYVGDVGQSDIEEVNRIEAGKNYGWNLKEGSFAYLLGEGVTDDLSALPRDLDAIDPIAQYDHDEGRSVTGGFVYRGSIMPHMVGQYIFGDFITNRLFYFDPETPGPIRELQIDPGGRPLPSNIITFGQDRDGEIYVGGAGPEIVRITPEPAAGMVLVVGVATTIALPARRRG